MEGVPSEGVLFRIQRYQRRTGWDHRVTPRNHLLEARVDYDDDGRVFNFAAGLLLGTVIGAGVALLMAPEPGRKTRRRLRRVAGEFADTAQDRWEGVSDEVRTRMDDAVGEARKKLRR